MITDEYQIQITVTLSRIADTDFWTNATPGYLLALARKYQGQVDMLSLIRDDLIENEYLVTRLYKGMTPALIADKVVGSPDAYVQCVIPTFMTDSIV